MPTSSEGKWRAFDWPNHLWIARDLLMDWLSAAFGSWRARIQLRAHGIRRIGSGFCVKGRLHVFTRRRNSIEIGDNVMLVSRYRSNPVGLAHPCVLDTLMGGSIRIGNGVGMSGVILSSRRSITIGNGVKLGGNVRIFDHDYHSLNFESRRDERLDRHEVRAAPVIIGDDVFVGTNAMILKGVTLGARSIIGAGAVVTRSVPPDEIWGGNPAAQLRVAPEPSGRAAGQSSQPGATHMKSLS